MTTETLDRPADETPLRTQAPDAGTLAGPRSPERPTAGPREAAPTPVADLPPIRILHLWPRLLNVAGDGGNVTAIEARARWRGIPTPRGSFSMTAIGRWQGNGLH